jgi:hypothetical protein
MTVLTDITNWTGTLWDWPISSDTTRLNNHAARKSSASSDHTPSDSCTADYYISFPYTDYYYW